MTQTQATALRSAIATVCHHVAMHLLLACSVMIFSFYAINCVNPAMGFLTAQIAVWFQMLALLLGLGTSLVSFLRQRLRPLSIAVMVCCMGLLVPSVITVIRGTDVIAATFLYQTALLLCAGLCFAFAIALIVQQRKTAWNAYRAAVATTASVETDATVQKNTPRD